MQKEKKIKRRETDQIDLKERGIEILKVPTRDQQVITLSRLIVPSVLDMVELMVKRIIFAMLVYHLVVVKKATK